MKKTKFMAGFIAFVLLLSAAAGVLAQGKIFVDLTEVQSDTPPQIINDRTMVPVRAITEMLGYDVYWIAEKEQVEVCEKGSDVPVIIMNIGSTRAYYSKYEEILGDTVGCEVELDSPAVLINNRTFVPLRFVSEAVGYTVEYDEETEDVYLFSPEYVKNHEGEGKGEDPAAESDEIGSVAELSMEEKVYVLSVTTEDWLAMTAEEKDEFVLLIGRWWEDYENLIVEDYDEMLAELEHQMEQYHKNGVNDYVFVAACEIYGVDKNIYIQAE